MEDRVKKNAHNRNNGVEMLRTSFANGIVSKQKINRRGYNKCIDISKDIRVTINETKIAEDAAWTVLKVYITNTNLKSWM